MGRILDGLRRMSCAVNIRWCLLATLGLAAVPGAAQDAPPPPPTPDAADVVAAFTLARRWLDDFRPPPVRDPAASATIRDAHGVCVILRHAGRVVGIGTDEAGDDLMLRRAMGRAMSQALGDPVISNLPDDLRDVMGRSLTLELDVAGRFVPLPGRTFEQIADRLEPELDGVALRRGADWAVVYPAQMQALNGARHLSGLLAGQAGRLGLPSLRLREIQRQDDLTVYRFRGIHLAQSSPGAFPFQAFRGDGLVTRAEVTLENVRDTARRLARHIASRRWPRQRPADLIGEYEPPPGLKGDYHPGTDEYEPIVAPLLDQALMAYALLRYAGAVPESPDDAQAAAECARDILRDITRLGESDRDEREDPVVAAALVHALCELETIEAEPALVELRATALARLEASLDADGAPIPHDGDPTRHNIDAHGQAMIAGAMSRALRLRIAGHPDPGRVRTVIDRAWRTLPEHQHVSLLPWIGWAEHEYLTATGEPGLHGLQLRALRTVVERSRIPADHDAGAPSDLAGGLALTGGPTHAAGATAQSLRPAAWMASVLDAPELIDDDEYDWARRGHLLTVRFLMQLTVREGSEWRYRSPPRTLGGIRAALWDVSQPGAAQAMGLLTASETLRHWQRHGPEGRPRP